MMGGTRMLNNHMHLRELKKPNGTRNEGEMMEFRAQMLAEGGSPGPPCRGMPNNRAAYLLPGSHVARGAFKNPSL